MGMECRGVAVAAVVDAVREVRASVEVPVTVADDFNFWNKPESDAVAREVDFIVLHAHPLWNGILLPDALDWTKETYASLQAEHPESPGGDMIGGRAPHAAQSDDDDVVTCCR